MRYKIAHWYGQQPPVPEAIKVGEHESRYADGRPTGDKPIGDYEVEIEDLHAFAEKHGQIKLVPPGGRGRGSQKEQWFIWVTTNNRWYQC